MCVTERATAPNCILEFSGRLSGQGKTRTIIFVEGGNMNRVLMSVIVLAALSAAGCNNAKSPDTVASDVSAAQKTAATATTEAQRDAGQSVAKAQTKTDDKAIEQSNTEAKAAYDVAIAKADGAHQVTLAKCQGLSGDVQKKCKDQADADYAAAKANAKAAETARMQPTN
jgi:hypothetical protein